MNTEWLCGCGAYNGGNLDHCGRCGRTRQEGEMIDTTEYIRKDVADAEKAELLEALEAVVRVADRKTDEFDQARAAIAKARGEK